MVDKAARFFIDEGEGLFKEEQLNDLKNMIIHHIIYGTIKVFHENGEIIAGARWNWVNEKQVEVLDAAVRRGSRGKKLVLMLARKCLEENPQCVGIFYENKEQTKKLYRPRTYFLKKERENNAYVKA
jgi:hypothetical protein